MKMENRLDVNLKPDYYDIFPLYKEEEMISRLDQLPFHLATLLNASNIREATKFEKGVLGLKKFLNENFIDQRKYLVEVLQHRGFSNNVTNAIGRVEREIFVPEPFKNYSYLDTSIPFTKYSVLSSPSIVALMIEMLNSNFYDKILEIGIGSGYHACCVNESFGKKCKIVGVEINADFLQTGSKVLRKLGYQNIDLISGNESILIELGSKFDCVYTASTILDIPDTIKRLLLENGVFQAARPLSKTEFEEEKPSAWVKSVNKLYKDYMMSNWREKFACLSTWRFEKGTFIPDQTIYDVAFVPYRTSASNNEFAITEELFPEFSALF